MGAARIEGEGADRVSIERFEVFKRLQVPIHGRKVPYFHSVIESTGHHLCPVSVDADGLDRLIVTVKDDLVGDGQAMLRLLHFSTLPSLLILFIRLIDSSLREEEIEAGTCQVFLILAILRIVFLLCIGFHHTFEIGSTTGLCSLNLLPFVNLVDFVLHFFPLVLYLTLASLIVDFSELESDATHLYLLKILVHFVLTLLLLSIQEALLALLLMLVAFEQRCFVACHQFGPLRDLFFGLGSLFHGRANLAVVQHAGSLDKLSVTDLRESSHLVIVLALDRLDLGRFFAELCQVGPHRC